MEFDPKDLTATFYFGDSECMIGKFDVDCYLAGEKQVLELLPWAELREAVMGQLCHSGRFTIGELETINAMDTDAFIMHIVEK
jgi:hypothetical protein